MTTTADPWSNRIVARTDMSPVDLVANPMNFRRHSKQQAAAMEGALREIGWVQQIVVNRRTGHVLDGHLRVELAVKRREPTVPVVLVDLDDNEERLALATFDPIGALAETDSAKLRELMADQYTRNAGLRDFFSSLAAETPAAASATAPLATEQAKGPTMCPHCGHEFFRDGSSTT